MTRFTVGINHLSMEIQLDGWGPMYQQLVQVDGSPMLDAKGTTYL